VVLVLPQVVRYLLRLLTVALELVVLPLDLGVELAALDLSH
jgi:hypothetical protein